MNLLKAAARVASRRYADEVAGSDSTFYVLVTSGNGQEMVFEASDDAAARESIQNLDPGWNATISVIDDLPGLLKAVNDRHGTGLSIRCGRIWKTEHQQNSLLRESPPWRFFRLSKSGLGLTDGYTYRC